jgi:hypothetical protein
VSDEISPAERRGPGRPKQFARVLNVAFEADVARIIVEEARRREVAFSEIVRLLVKAGLAATQAEQDEFEAVS